MAEESEFSQYFEVHQKNGDVELNKVTFENGELNVLARHPDITVLATKLAQFFKDAGGTNYVELIVNTPEYGDLIVTVQRKFGKTPHEMRIEAECELAKAKGDAK